MNGQIEAATLEATGVGVAAPVLVRREDAVAYLTLNRPEAANSIDATLAKAFRSAMSDLHGDGAVRALVIEGAGEIFCAGGDVVSFADENGAAARYVEGLIADLHAGLELLSSFHAPIVAAVRGAAAGAGLGLALGADIVVAGQSARFLMAYAGLGLTPDGGTSWMLPRVVGLRRALELTFLNTTLSADEALRMGLITEVRPDDGVTARVYGLAKELAAGPTAAFAATRRLMRGSTQSDYATQLRHEAAQIVGSFSTDDGLEGVRAFSERRPPVFHGS